MCLPTKTDKPSTSTGSASRSIFSMGALMLFACLGGPALAGAIGGLGVGVLLGAGGAIFALALCALVPVLFVGLRRRSARPESRIEVGA